MATHTLHGPESIAVLRRAIFELKDEITLSHHDWVAIWPYIDNMWVERNASRAKDKSQFNCRIWRNDADKKSGSGRRNRVRRDVVPCSMKMYVVRRGGGDAAGGGGGEGEEGSNAGDSVLCGSVGGGNAGGGGGFVTISRCAGRTNDVREHNHELGYLDKVKTPTAIMRFAAEIMSVGKTPSEAVKELRMHPVVQALERDGGLYIDSNRVRNAHKASQQPPTNGTSVLAHKRNYLALPASSGIDMGSSAAGAEDLSMLDASGAEEDRGPPLPIVCQCGAIRLSTPYAKPDSLYHCHCLECQKQSASSFGTSALFPAGAFFPLPDELLELLSVYTRPTKNGGTSDCYFCKNCGVRIMHHGKDAEGGMKEYVAVKGGVIEGLDWKGAHHIWTKRAVVPIPAGSRKWRESPEPEPAPPMHSHARSHSHPDLQDHEHQHEHEHEHEHIHGLQHPHDPTEPEHIAPQAQMHVHAHHPIAASMGLDDLAAMATAAAGASSAANGLSMLEQHAQQHAHNQQQQQQLQQQGQGQQGKNGGGLNGNGEGMGMMQHQQLGAHGPVDPSINPDLPAFPFP